MRGDTGRRPLDLDDLLAEVRQRLSGTGPKAPILLVGGIGSGKTTTAFELLERLREEAITVGGLLAPRRMSGKRTIGYAILDLERGETRPFAGPTPAEVRLGRFFTTRDALDFADRAIVRAAGSADVVFVDEVGRLELDGGGHARPLRHLLTTSSLPILLVREAFVDDVRHAFGLAGSTVHRVHRCAAISERKQHEANLWQIVDSIPFPLLVTHGDDGFPRSRPMHLIHRDGPILWFPTSRASAKAKQIQTNPQVSVLFVDTARFNYASLYGHAELIVDPDREQSLWHDEWNDAWPDGPTDPDYVLLRVAAVQGTYSRGVTGESGTVDLRQE